MIGRRSLLTVLLSSLAGLLPQSLQARRRDTLRRTAERRTRRTKPEGVAEDKIWTSYYSGTRVWGYVNKHSVVPGETFDFMASSKRGEINGRIEIYRIGHYPNGDRELVWRGENVEVSANGVQSTAAALGAGWPPAVDHVATDGWRSGYYTIDFIDDADGNRDENVAYIVVTNPDKDGDILVELSTNTYQAYNKWGGYSFYETAFVGDRAQMISFNRPTPPDFFEYEYYFVKWLEGLAARQQLKIDYATNFDVFHDPEFATKYPLFISGSHNEYWSKEEFDAVYDRIFKLGKNTLFLGANTAYWQVRYADLDRSGRNPDWGRQLICYKDEDDPVRYRNANTKDSILLVTERFRDEARRPETMLMGVAYQNYFEAAGPAKYPYYVNRTDFPFFRGTGYNKGDRIGDVVGYEWDNTDPDGDGKRLWDAEKSQIKAIDPSAINVLFTGSPIDLSGQRGKAEAVYFVSKAGAKVFSSGSIRWAWGLGKPSFASEQFRKFNENLVMHLLDRESSSRFGG